VDNAIQNVANLRGKRLACAEATPSHYFALFALTQGGLTNRDVNWVFTTSAVEAANVYKAGKVDAAVSWSPDVYMAAKERGHILASTKEASNLIADIFVARGDFIEKHPEDLRRFVAGWLKGVEMASANPDRTAALLAKSFSGIGLEDAKGMLEDVKLPNFAENRAFF
jgi:NitT/TauT family transport system substrate-binding protein